jgi:hypothetical protein
LRREYLPVEEAHVKIGDCVIYKGGTGKLLEVIQDVINPRFLVRDASGETLELSAAAVTHLDTSDPRYGGPPLADTTIDQFARAFRKGEPLWVRFEGNIIGQFYVTRWDEDIGAIDRYEEFFCRPVSAGSPYLFRILKDRLVANPITDYRPGADAEAL